MIRTAGAVAALTLVLGAPIAAMAATSGSQANTSAEASAQAGISAQTDAWLGLSGSGCSYLNSGAMSNVWANDQTHVGSQMSTWDMGYSGAGNGAYFGSGSSSTSDNSGASGSASGSAGVAVSVRDVGTDRAPLSTRGGV